jgi:hypothetical protein
MQKTLFALSLGIAGYLLAAHGVMAQQAQCAERQTIVESLQDRYGETRQSIGLAQNDGIVEVFASTSTGSWTILFTAPNGSTCLVASGQNYENTGTPPAPAGKKA